MQSNKIEENIKAEIEYVTGKLADLQQCAPAFTDRELKELELAITYARHFAHGTTGHNQLILTNKLFEYLSQALSALTPKLGATDATATLQQKAQRLESGLECLKAYLEQIPSATVLRGMVDIWFGQDS